MDQSIFFLVLAIGLLFGGLVSWLIFRNEARHAYEAARGENESERAALNERLQGREEQIQQMKAAAESQARECARLADELREEAGKRAAAEERAGRVAALEIELAERARRVEELQAASAALQAEKAELAAHIEDIRKTADEKITLLIEAQQELKKSFAALAAESLKSNNEAFLTLARETLAQFQQGAATDLEIRQNKIEELLKPVRESLGKMDDQIRQIEKEREGAYAGLREQVAGLLETQTQLRAETGNLVKALRAPQVRGRWGEMQLERVAELAGLARNADFILQSTVQTEDGAQRADMIVKLPGGRQVVVDAKTPFSAYLESLDAQDETTRIEKLRQHAAQVRAHLSKLGEKRYHEQFQPTPDFVVAFLPGETFFSAALEHDPSLIEYGVEQKVVMATPTTLIALLKAVAYGWRQEKQAANARQISDLGKELYGRLATLGDNFSRLGLNLERAVNSYNQTVGSLEGRVLVSARRFRDLGAAAGDEIGAIEPVDSLPRVLQAPELTQLSLQAAAGGGDGFSEAVEAANAEECEEEPLSEAVEAGEPGIQPLAGTEAAVIEPVDSEPAAGLESSAARLAAAVSERELEPAQAGVEAAARPAPEPEPVPPPTPAVEIPPQAPRVEAAARPAPEPEPVPPPTPAVEIPPQAPRAETAARPTPAPEPVPPPTPAVEIPPQAPRAEAAARPTPTPAPVPVPLPTPAPEIPLQAARVEAAARPTPAPEPVPVAAEAPSNESGATAADSPEPKETLAEAVAAS